MNDYWQKIQDMNQDKVLSEIETLTKRLFRLPEGSPMWQQVNGMLDEAQLRHRDLLEFQRAEIDTTPEIIEIGEIDTTVYTPDYTKEELVHNIASFYYDKNGPITDNTQQEQVIEDPKLPTQNSEPQPSEEVTIDVPKFGAKK